MPRFIVSIFAFSSLVVCCCIASSAKADLTPVGPFSGTYSEGFESFDDYLTNPNAFEGEPIQLFGGQASAIAGATPNLLIFQPSNNANWVLGSSGNVTPADGTKGLGVFREDTALEIDFNVPVIEFGGYFAGLTDGANPIPIVFEFFDSNNVQVGATQTINYLDATGNGTLEWSGWHFDTAISRAVITTDFLASDGLQITTIPEPNTLICFLAIGILACKNRHRKMTLKRQTI